MENEVYKHLFLVRREVDSEYKPKVTLDAFLSTRITMEQEAAVQMITSRLFNFNKEDQKKIAEEHGLSSLASQVHGMKMRCHAHTGMTMHLMTSDFELEREDLEMYVSCVDIDKQTQQKLKESRVYG